MSCNIKVPFTGAAADVVSKARNAISGAGGNFTGDDLTGSFNLSTMAGDVAGSYNVNGNTLEVNITDKPMFLPCDMIESQLKQYIK